MLKRPVCAATNGNERTLSEALHQEAASVSEPHTTVQGGPPELPCEKAMSRGRELRKTVPRSAHAIWKPSLDRTDPVATLLASGKKRLENLLPLRYGRMSQSAFAYMRGSAAMM